jgi:beta-galactosidase/beta-glucuronidase
VLPARTQEGWSDEETFRRLEGTHETVADLPVAWRFQLDPDEVGDEEGWHRAEFDDRFWAVIRIREFWEVQGYSPYDGAAWYRLRYTVPELPAGRTISLAFGGVADEAAVWVNGRLLHRSRFGANIRHEPFLVDVTGHVKPGETACLAVRVWNTGWCGGIWKNVKLVASFARNRK